MIRSILANNDATLYELSESMNTGLDEVIEVSKQVDSGSGNYNTRALIKFDLTNISQSLVDGDIGADVKYYLNLYSTEAKEIPAEYNLFAYPISQSWDNGIGQRFHKPITEEGTSWKYRDGEVAGTQWLTASYATGTTGSYSSNPGGATWFTGSGFEASQSFGFATVDVRMDVTDIVNKWLSGSVNNDGFIVKRSDADEASLTEFGSIKFYSTETHTIYQPRLEIAWDDSSFTTGSLAELTDENIVLYTKGLKRDYKEASIAKIRVVGRSKYPVRTFATSSAVLDVKYLPSSSYYSVKDTVTEETIIPFDDNYTKISSDETGNFFFVRMDSFQLERYYKFVFKIVRDNTEEYFDNGFYFKVIR